MLAKFKYLAPVVVILIIYVTTLQHIPNGSSHPYMIDVGETQVALNIWGTLHTTGYPLYTMLGNLFTPLPQWVGINPAAAASLFSMMWTLIALLALYWLLADITEHHGLVVGCLVLLALMRSIWIHSLIAEVYSLSLAILMALWLLVFRFEEWSLQKRVSMLALLGGIGVAHHRAIAFAAPALIIAILPQLIEHRWQMPKILLTSVPLALIGFLPYLYLPLRANAHAEWVYGKVGTWDGFWFLFWGREADYLVKRPSTLAGWLENFEGTLHILMREMTPPGFIIALLCLITALWKSPHQKVIRIVTLSGLGFFVWAVSYHQAVLPEAILMMLLPTLVVGIVLTADWLWQQHQYLGYASLVGILMWSAVLYPYQREFILPLVEDETGLHSVEAASDVPRNPLEKPVLMLSWGPRFFAASYSRLVTGENADLPMVDHNADFPKLAAEGKTIYTEPDTLFGYPVAWWSERMGEVYLTAAGVNLVRLGTEPRLVEIQRDQLQTEVTDGIWLAGAELTCDDEQITLAIGWYAQEKPQRDLSVLVHLLNHDAPIPLAQADSRAPVFGWRPTSSWLEKELVQDFYQLPRLANGVRVKFGMFEQLSDGTFANYGETVLPITNCAS